MTDATMGWSNVYPGLIKELSGEQGGSGQRARAAMSRSQWRPGIPVSRIRDENGWDHENRCAHVAEGSL